jgi:hypothetical protein
MECYFNTFAQFTELSSDTEQAIIGVPRPLFSIKEKNQKMFLQTLRFFAFAFLLPSAECYKTTGIFLFHSIEYLSLSFIA